MSQNLSTSNFLRISSFISFIALAVIAPFHHTWALNTPVTAKADEGSRNERFLNLFHQAPWGAFTILSDEVTDYVMNCCGNPDDALELLTQSGFRVVVATEPIEVERINRKYDQSRRSWPPEHQLEFDKFISGSRGPGVRFWRVATSYNVSLFIKDNKIVRVFASVDTTLP